MDQTLQLALEAQNPWWFGKPFETGINRLPYFPEIPGFLKSREILLLVGARRSGKSTLVYQVIQSLLKNGTEPRAILYINFDEPVFFSHAKDPAFLRELIEEYIASHPALQRFYVCIDEVQNYEHWAGTMKILHDTKSCVKCILTGSTSSLLKQEVSGRLSGRYFTCTIFPLSFREFLVFRGLHNLTTIERRQAFREYLHFGGFPRVVLEKDEALKEQILKNYYETIYLKDIIYPNKVRNNADLVDLLYLLMSNVGNLLSYSAIGNSLRVAVTTVQEYIGYAENAFLLHPLMKFDYSAKKQLANPKKIYAIDTGLVNAVSFRFSENRGRLLENIVYLALKRHYSSIFYHKGRYECDFLLKEHEKITGAIQVAHSLAGESVRKREIRGIMEAMETHKLFEGLILTEEEAGEEEIDGRKIRIVPIPVWLESLG